MQASNSHDHDVRLRWDLRPGDIGYVIYLHGLLYRDDFGWDHTFEGYVAQSFADFAIDYDPDRDRLWIAELGGEIVGCIGIHRAPGGAGPAPPVLRAAGGPWSADYLSWCPGRAIA
jgi:hypothetical protein